MFIECDYHAHPTLFKAILPLIRAVSCDDINALLLVTSDYFFPFPTLNIWSSSGRTRDFSNDD